MSSRGSKKKKHRLLRLRGLLDAQITRLEKMEHELFQKLATQTTIYLDTNHWINLRHIILGSHLAKQEYQEILHLLRRLRIANKICCPLSSSMLEELMKQSDFTTRQTMAKLMDELSGGVCLHFLLRIAVKEWCQHVKNARIGAALGLDIPVWTRVGFCCGGERHLNDLGFWTQERVRVLPAWVDKMWAATFEDEAVANDFQQTPDHLVQKFLQWMNDAQKRSDARQFRFEQLRDNEKLLLSNSLKNDFLEAKAVPEREFHELFSFLSTRDNHLLFPSLHVLANIGAGVALSKKKVVPSDALDFMHASAAVPYCDAFFCDDYLATLLKGKPLELGKVYETVVSSRPVEIIKYLKALET